MLALSFNNKRIKILWPSDVPFAEYKSLIDLINFLLDTSDAKVFGITFRNDSLNWSKYWSIVLSISAYSKSCCTFCTGFALYVTNSVSAPEVKPLIVSPISNLWLAEMYNAEPLTSSTTTVASVPDVWPLTISPVANSTESSNTILSTGAPKTPFSERTYALVSGSWIK